MHVEKMSGGAAAAIEGPSPNNDLVEENEEMSTQTTQNLNTSTVATVISSSSCSGGNGVESSSPPSSSATIPQSIEQHCRLLEEENQNLKESESRLQQQYADSQRRERILMRRLANKEQELQDYVSQIAEYKSGQAPGPAALRSALLDPAVNILFEKLKHELQSTKAKLEETQNELSAWKFTPDSNTGKRLMAKCRLLYQENEELGKMTSNGRLAKLEGELAMQKSFNEEVKKSQSELDDLIQELDVDVEGMQSTILLLQQELKSARDRIQVLEKENCQIKNGTTDELDKSTIHLVNGKSSPQQTTQQLEGHHDISESFDSEERTSKVLSNNYTVLNNSSNSIIVNRNNVTTDDHNLRTNSINTFYNGNDVVTNINGGDNDKAQNESITNSSSYLESSSGSNNSTSNTNNSKANKQQQQHSQKKRNYDSDSSENSSTNGCTLRNNKKLKKKVRRSSVLSIDLNEEDTQIADESDEEETNQRIVTRRKSARNHQNGEHN